MTPPLTEGEGEEGRAGLSLRVEELVEVRMFFPAEERASTRDASSFLSCLFSAETGQSPDFSLVFLKPGSRRTRARSFTAASPPVFVEI